MNTEDAAIGVIVGTIIGLGWGDCSYINTSVEVTKLARYWASFAIISSCDSPSATYAL